MSKFRSKMQKLEDNITIFKIVEALFIVITLLSIAMFVAAIYANTKSSVIWFLTGSILNYIASTLLYRLKNRMRYRIKKYIMNLEYKYDINLECIRGETSKL